MINSPQQGVAWHWGRTVTQGPAHGQSDRNLLWIVDAALFGVICVAPFVFGGRHDLGRLVFSTLVVLAATVWLVRQCILPMPYWTRTAAHGVLLLATVLVVAQLIPLPAAIINWLSPRTAELLPLWSPGASVAKLGAWRTLTFTPHETMLSLSMLLSYILLFIVVVQRVQSAADIGRMLRWIAISAVVMAGFGLLQYFTSNGRFFWFYEHPFRTTDRQVLGSFANKNHFAHFLVLGAGPLAAWLIAAFTQRATNRALPRRTAGRPLELQKLILLAAVVTVLLAIMLSLSRGGALALAASAVTMSVIYFRWGRIEARHVASALGMVLVLLGMLSLYGYEKVAARLDDFTEGSLQTLDREQGRRKIWAANLAAIRDGWLTGAGAGSHRAIYPVYLADSPPAEYTHAESSYLQIATEMGVGGVALLAAGLGFCGYWCSTCLSRLASGPEQLWFGAVGGGLVASAVHSLIDFVWYIPACMSITVVMAACALRLAQLSLPETRASTFQRLLNRSRCCELSAAGILVGTWCIHTLFGPAMASIHWDRYLRASADKTQAARQHFSAVLKNQELVDSSIAQPLLDSMLRHLEAAAYWDPAHSRVQLRLANKCLAQFELVQQRAQNSMQLFQLREAAVASRFDSAAALRAWLERAAGENVVWLYRAYEHARHAVTLGPLQGEAYLLLADLCFLDGTSANAARAYADQGLQVRPYDADVLFEAGYRNLLAGDLNGAFKYWKPSFRHRGKHQLRIIHAVAGPQVPAAVFIQEFQPDWWTLRFVWNRYRQLGQTHDLDDLLAYAAQVSDRQVQDDDDFPPAYIWLGQAQMYSDVDRPSDAAACLEEAYRVAPHLYDVRYALARALIAAGRLPESEPHVRWCLSRHPDSKRLKALLLEINKQRFAQREQASDSR